MAKEKKQELTIEDKLAQALVTEDEQPYQVPKNWVWTYLMNVCRFENGYAFKSDDYKDFGTPLIRISNICDGEVDISKCVYIQDTNIDTRFIINNGDLLIAMSGATTGKNGVYQLDIPAYLNQRVGNIKVIDPNVVSNKFRNYYINDKNQEILNKAYGGAQPNISSTIIGEMLFPLPPLAEQQRIVDRIESLFAKLDHAKELTHNSLDAFETRKAAMLRKAFTGELTAKWREQHGVGMDSWENKRFDSVADIKSNLVDPKEYLDFPHIAPDNIERRTGQLLDYHKIAEDGVTSGKHRFFAGQILYSKIRPYLSKVVIVDFDGLCSADMYPIESKEDTKYLWYFMLSDEFLEQASSAGSRSVLPKINQKELSALKVVIPSSPEQQEIVRILDSLFEKEQKARELCDVIDKIDLIKKAVLARAFRGELGTNDHAEESAVELLKDALKQKLNNADNNKMNVNKSYKSIKKIDSLDSRKVSKMQNKDLLNLLNEHGGKLTPLKLYKMTELDIEEFYAVLKGFVSLGEIVEIRRTSGETYLEAKNEN